MLFPLGISQHPEPRIEQRRCPVGKIAVGRLSSCRINSSSRARKASRSRHASRLRSGVRSRKDGWNIGNVGTGWSRPGISRSNQRPRSRVMPWPCGSSAAAAVPPHSTRIVGFTSATWRSTKGRQEAISAMVGVRLPGGRQ